MDAITEANLDLLQDFPLGDQLISRVGDHRDRGTGGAVREEF